MAFEFYVLTKKIPPTTDHINHEIIYFWFPTGNQKFSKTLVDTSYPTIPHIKQQKKKFVAVVPFFPSSNINMVKPIIAPSILAADFANLGCNCKRVVDTGDVEWLHLDVMDGHFVPNISLGPPIISSLRKQFPREGDKPIVFDCHMMVSEPDEWIEEIAKAGGDSYTFHFEATKDPARVIKKIKEHGLKAAMAIKPKTPVEEVFPYAEDLDMVLVMTVEPGFGGQKFMPDMMPKVETLREKYPNLDVQVDGGLGKDTIQPAADAGANVIVAGTSVFKPEDPKPVVQHLKQTVADAIQARNK